MIETDFYFEMITQKIFVSKHTKSAVKHDCFLHFYNVKMLDVNIKCGKSMKSGGTCLKSRPAELISP